MKRSLWTILLLVMALAACRKKGEPAPYPEVERLMGKWKFVAYEVVQEKDTVWKEVEGNNGYEFMVRYDGVILDPKGMKRCCDPPYYFINGVRFEVVPDAPVEHNPMCATMYCAPCLNANYNLEEDGSLIYYCNSSQLGRKYEKE